jgi:hypothetical protein
MTARSICYTIVCSVEYEDGPRTRNHGAIAEALELVLDGQLIEIDDPDNDEPTVMTVNVRSAEHDA